VKRGIAREVAWIRQGTGTKIAAVAGTVLPAVLVGRFLFTGSTKASVSTAERGESDSG
jgi:hypothetical protein